MTLDVKTHPDVTTATRVRVEDAARRSGLPLSELEDLLQDPARCRAFLMAEAGQEHGRMPSLRIVAADSARGAQA